MLHQLKTNLTTRPLPGLRAQLTMAPPGRSLLPKAPGNVRQAAVLALFFPKNDELHLLFIQRTSPPGDKHGGQISFPGGSVDPSDQDTRHTALREAWEEVGVLPESVEVWRALTPLYIPVSNFNVAAYVGYTPMEPAYQLQVSEVARVLSLPFRAFLEPGVRQVGHRKLASGLSISDVPYFDVEGEDIWGATSMFVAELIALAAPATDR